MNRFDWMEAALASHGLSPAEAKIASRLGLFANDGTGLCNPSLETLSELAAFTVSYVVRLLKRLKSKGWIGFPKNAGGPGRSNRYELRLPPSETTLTNPSLLRASERLTNPWKNTDRSVAEQCPYRQSNLKELSKVTSGERFSSSNSLAVDNTGASNGIRKVAPNPDWRARRDNKHRALAELRARAVGED